VNQNKHEILIRVDKEKWQQALAKSFNKTVKEVKVAGFRKGKVPRDVYENKYGVASLYNEAINYVLDEALLKALTDNHLVPIVQPQADIKKVDQDGVDILFNIMTTPIMKIKKYKGLKIKREPLKITDEEIDKEIKALQERYAEIVLKDDQIIKGDIAVIDFEGFKDNIPFEGGKGANYPLEIGSKTFVEGFEEQLIGAKKGDQKEIKVTFPKDYPSEELKNEEVVFKVRINEVKTKVIPKMDQDFFKDLDIEGVTNKEELIKEVKNQLKEAKKAKLEDVHLDNILAAIAQGVEVDIPEEMIKEELERMIRQLEHKLKLQGITLEQYYKIAKINHQQLCEKGHDEAKRIVLYRLMIEEISKLEKIEVNKEEIDKEIKEKMDQYKLKKDEILKNFGSNELMEYDLRMRKTMVFLQENN